jgi:hypothetical protein
VSVAGLLAPGFYSKETLYWQVQCRGQDVIDLFFIVPTLVVTGSLSSKKRISLLLYTGTLLYIIYTFVIYCFDVHFNSLFPVYCLILFFSFYNFLWIVYKQVQGSPVKAPVDIRVSRATGLYFMLVSVLFYFLWLADIIPSVINNSVPENLKQSGLPTNPVHVIDLAFFLPAIFLTGALLLRKKSLGSVLAVIFLFFFILMDITIGWLTIKMKQEELASGNLVIIAMTALATVSLVLLVWNAQGIQFKNDQSMEPADKTSFMKDQF